jgi:hypothetical protein
VFRRGSTGKPDISRVLGGNGLKGNPIVTNVPEVGRQFIKKGHVYLASNEQWSCFKPKFAGNDGFELATSCFDGDRLAKSNQQSFHMFRQCPKRSVGSGCSHCSRFAHLLTARLFLLLVFPNYTRSDKPGFHGDGIHRKYVYCGVYKLTTKDPVTDLPDPHAHHLKCSFKNIPPDAQEYIVEFLWSRGERKEVYIDKCREELQRLLNEEELQDCLDDELWPGKKNESTEHKLQMRLLMKHFYEGDLWNMYSLDFDHYDEELYDALSAHAWDELSGRVAASAELPPL